jgi:lipoate-protein ligase A
LSACGPRRNIALNRALLERAKPARFKRCDFCDRPQPLLGSPERRAGLIDYCKAHNIAIQRQITGGIAIYHETQLDWGSICTSATSVLGLQAIAKRICHAAASAISALGVDARFRRHDIGWRRRISAAASF